MDQLRVLVPSKTEGRKVLVCYLGEDQTQFDLLEEDQVSVFDPTRPKERLPSNSRDTLLKGAIVAATRRARVLHIGKAPPSNPLVSCLNFPPPPTFPERVASSESLPPVFPAHNYEAQGLDSQDYCSLVQMGNQERAESAVRRGRHDIFLIYGGIKPM